MADRAEALRSRLLATFRVEAQEHLQTIAGELDTIARNPHAVAGLEGLLRAMHTLKGAARSVGHTDFENAAHRCETLISALIRRGSPPSSSQIWTLQEASDTLAGVNAGNVPPERLAHVAAETAEAAVPQPVEPVAAAPHEAPAPVTAAETIRVEVGRLDNVVTLAEGLLSPKLASVEHVRLARDIAGEIERVRAHVDVEFREELRVLEARARQLVAVLRQDSRTLNTTIDDLNDEMRHVRMMPVSGILDAFPLMVRDLCRETGKEVDWHVVGAELEIDRKVLELVKDPLIHLVRNAIDHGIEMPHEREAAGKPRRGNITVRIAPSESGRIRIEVSDDGRGFALDAIRDAVVRARVTTVEKVAALSDPEVAQLAFSAGVSTSPVITTISGHGRGLAIVRERIERVEGRIATFSVPGQGTRIRLGFPASIITYRALLVQTRGQRFLLPLDAIERVFALPEVEVRAALERGALTSDEDALPFGNLGAILGLPRLAGAENERENMRQCVVVRSEDRVGVLLVNDVLGESEVVIKQLRPPLLRIRNVLASALLGTGELVLVLRPHGILTSIKAHAASDLPVAPLASPRARRVLVVDDSTTTRTMERNLFEAAGYTVRVAADGADAWEILQREELDIFVSDVDMPRMNGFELTAHIRSEPRLRELPVVLVTALEGREDKEQGIRVGANAYVLKSGFNQANLLDLVRRLT